MSGAGFNVRAGRPWGNTSVMDRFMAKVSPEPMSGCWLWTGTVNSGRERYGVMLSPGSKSHRMLMAHRVSWELHHGPIPAGLFVCHKCDNPPCVNPDHLFLGTVQDNSDDMVRKGRSFVPMAIARRAQTHCKRGHEFSPENTYWSRGRWPRRNCRECHRIAVAADRKAKREIAA